MSDLNLCRLCVTSCNNYKSLYDEDGKSNVLHEMTIEYFHPKIVDMDKAKHLTVICLQCFRQMRSFHTFQFSVMLAQAKLVEMLKSENKTQKEDQKPPVQNLKPVKTERQEELINYVVETDPSGILNENNSHNVVKEENRDHIAADLSEVVFVVNEFAALSDLPAQSLANEDKNGSMDRSKTPPKLEVMDAETGSHSTTSDEDMPLGQVVPANQTHGESFNSADGYHSETIDLPIPSSDHSPSESVPETLEYLLAKWMPNIKCIKCPRYFARLTYLRRHFKRYHRIEEYAIACCSRLFKEQHDLKEHLLLHGHSMIDTNKNALSIQQDKVCANNVSSNTSLANIYYRRKHYAMHTNRPAVELLFNGRTAFICKLCGETKYSMASFRKHRSLVHIINDERLVCSVCGMNCKTTRIYQEHMASHNNRKLYKCVYCPGTYRTQSGMMTHRRRRHPHESNTNCYVFIGENDEMNQMSHETGEKASATDSSTPTTSKAAAEAEETLLASSKTLTDEKDDLTSEDVDSENEDTNSAITFQNSSNHISLPEVTIMDVNTDTEYGSEEEASSAEHLGAKRKLDSRNSTEDDISSDYSSDSADADKKQSRLSNVKSQDALDDQNEKHSKCQSKFACKVCNKGFDSKKGLTVHYRRIHKNDTGST